MEDAENVAESAVSEGWLEVRPGKQPECAIIAHFPFVLNEVNFSEHTQKLLELQEKAKTAKKGRWSEDDPQSHVRNIHWNADDMQAVLNEWKKKEIDVVIEQVR